MNSHPTVDWMLDDLVDATGAKYAVALSTDGMVIQKSATIDRDDADALAALASSLSSVTAEAGRRFGGGPVRQTVVEMARQYLVATDAGPNARLVLVADGDSNLGEIGYHMSRLIKQVGERLGAMARTTADTRRSPWMAG